MSENSSPAKPKRSSAMLWAVLAVCIAPIAASYFYYYVVKPGPATNYGALLDPRQYPMPNLNARSLDGQPRELASLNGKWRMLMVAPAACAESCREKLFQMRQLRLTQGREKDRIERVWLITDEQALDTILLREYDGTHFIRAERAKIAAWLPAEASTRIEDHLYFIDPLGNLMMRYPKDADPHKIKKDLNKLIKISKIG
ncbi:cytochrome C oxidase subunit I [Massilia sp. W12]|uniref:SCO family protein n=1 Tax=Massilia sp. W12 TaxID=3126507 RepID=UPI0030D22A5E